MHSLQERADPRESPRHGQQLVPRAHEPPDVRRPPRRQQRRRRRRQEDHLRRVHRHTRGGRARRQGRQVAALKGGLIARRALSTGHFWRVG